MGGKGSGGARVGAGRRRKSQADGELTGSRRTRARAKEANQTGPTNQRTGNQTESASAAVVDTQIPQPPGNLTLDELAEWNDLAPRAAKEGTLTDSTMQALRDLCQARVLKDRLLRTIGDHGVVGRGGTKGTLAAHPLLARFTTLLQRVEAGMLRFKLAPMAKDLREPEKPADPFAEFDGPAVTRDGESIN